MPTPATTYTFTYRDPPKARYMDPRDFIFVPPAPQPAASLPAPPPTSKPVGLPIVPLPPPARPPRNSTGVTFEQGLQLQDFLAQKPPVVPDVSVTLDINHSDHDRQELYDSAGNYLFTNYTLYMDCLFNPQVNSYTLQGRRPLPIDGFDPVDIDNDLRHFLQQPRKILTISLAGKIILTCPDALAPVNTDCELGPTPISVEVKQIHGKQTFEVHLVYRVAINETRDYLGTQNAPFLLSNVWVPSESTDERLYTTRTYRGRAKFRRDWMAKGTVPDDYRAFVLPPPVPNWKRTIDSIGMNEAGTELEYVVSDRQLPMAFLLSGIVDVQVTHTASATMPDLVSLTGIATARQSAKYAPRAGGYGGGIAAGAFLALRGAFIAAEAIGGDFQDAMRVPINLIGAGLSVRTVNITITVTGQPGTAKAILRAAARLVLAARLGRNAVGGNNPTVEGRLGMCIGYVETDTLDTMVELTAQFIAGLGGRAQQLIQAVGGQLPSFIPSVDDLVTFTDDVPGLMQQTPSVLAGQIGAANPLTPIPDGMTPPGGRGIATPILMPQLPNVLQSPPLAPFVPRAPLPVQVPPLPAGPNPAANVQNPNTQV